jgi:hypothetical protein
MWMRFLFLCLSLLVGYSSWSQSTKVNLPASYIKNISEELKPFYAPSEGQSEDLLEGDVISMGKVNSPTDKEQQLMLFTAGVHPRNCIRAMRKLSLYENYHQYIGFIKKSTYDDKNEKVAFSIDHTLLPFPMLLSFKIPRITKPGLYPFTFDTGFLKDLRGTIIVKDLGPHCLLGLKSDWRGPETKIPNIAFEAFIQTVGKLGLEHLIRVSLF